ncbi:TonB-dependent receptor plug domain-containing protein [Parafilimonas sp.]|uniref:TonB-dependent receptor plug domain-containing protein n=1 Tax=Parafilimonas sp. TaxID=1969739 RepID=UPI0039E66BF8
MKKILVTTIVLALIQFAKAQTDSSGNLLDEVVVTAAKAPKKLSETGKVIKVITKEQIESAGSKDLAQILNEQAGVTVNGATSNPGKDKSLYLLGATDKYTLILLDGIPLNEPAGVGGSFDLRLLSLDNIERIEILQGSQSTLYGSNAVAGVVNIISKKPETKQPQLNGLLTYGSYNSFKGNANISQKTKLLEYDLNYTYYNTDGISEAKDTTGKAGFDKDGFTQNALQGIIGINITDRLKLSPYFRYTHFKGDYDDDAFTDGSNAYIASLINTGLNGSYNYRTGSLHFNYGYDFTKRDYRSSYSYQSSGKFNHAEAYVNQTFSSNVQMVGGVSYQSYTMKDVDTTNSIISPYISLFLHSNNGFNLELGGRYNHHNQYGDNFTYSFNPSYLINNTVKIFANITSGFRAPSIGELFGPYGANPDLKPEKSNTQEAGLQAFFLEKQLTFTVNGFNRNISDVIIYGLNGYENLNKQHDHGVQAEVNYNNKHLQLSASYAYITGKLTDKSSGSDTSYYNLVRRPKHAIKLSGGYNITPALYVSTSIQVTGRRTDSYYDPNTYISSQVSLNAYTLWNAYAQYSFLKKRLNVFADVKNIACNTNYYEVYGYAVQGTTVNAGLHFKL